MRYSASTLAVKASQTLFNRCSPKHPVATAIFDVHGLPIKYIARDRDIQKDWLQAIVQTISLKLLLQVSFGLEGFTKAVVSCCDSQVVIEKQPAGFKAMVYRNQLDEQVALTA